MVMRIDQISNRLAWDGPFDRVDYQDRSSLRFGRVDDDDVIPELDGNALRAVIPPVPSVEDEGTAGPCGGLARTSES